MPKRTLMLLILMGAMWTEARAQLPDLEPSAGTRVRISAPELEERPLIGTVDAVDGASISLARERTGASIRIPVELIRSLELSLGRARGRGALIGAGIGFGASVAFGLVCQLACGSEDGGANLAAAGGLLVGIFIGAPAGAALGALAFAPERWHSVPIR